MMLILGPTPTPILGIMAIAADTMEQARYVGGSKSILKIASWP